MNNNTTTLTACARTQEDAARELENRLVDLFEQQSAKARAEYPLSKPGITPSPETVLAHIHERRGALHAAICRVSAAASRMRVA